MRQIKDLATTDDWFLGDRLTIRQPAKGYRAGFDAVLLAAAIPADLAPWRAGAKAARMPPDVGAPSLRHPALRILDVGAGVGTVGLCAAARLRDAEVALFERSADLAALARGNVAGNGLDARVSVFEGALAGSADFDTDADDQCAAVPGGTPRGVGDTARGRAANPVGPIAALAETFDVVVANPPFHDDGNGTAAPNALKAAAHAMPAGTLDAWLRFMARMAKPSGAAIVIHKAEALADILSACNGRFGGLIVRPIQARRGDNALRVIVAGVKGSRAPMTLRPPLILHDDGQSFTAEVDGILRRGEPLAL